MKQNGEITHYAILSFEYEGERYTVTVNKSEMNLADDPDTWFWYFDENGYHFEVWGSRDEQGHPCTSSETMFVALAVNVYEPANGYNDGIDQVDDIDVIEID